MQSPISFPVEARTTARLIWSPVFEIEVWEPRSAMISRTSSALLGGR
jgi:hypothetical protein